MLAIDSLRDRGTQDGRGAVARETPLSTMLDRDPDRRAPLPTPDLKTALRAARVEDAERSRALADLHGAEIARLEMLKEAIEPVLAQVPDGVEMFDAAIMPGARPRLFIDMIGFVEMAHDRHRYRFIQDTREGRVTLCDSGRIDIVGDAITSYIARRLIEREKALTATGDAPVAFSAATRRARLRHVLRIVGRLVLEYLGIVSLVVLAWVFGDALYHWALSR